MCRSNEQFGGGPRSGRHRLARSSADRTHEIVSRLDRTQSANLSKVVIVSATTISPAPTPRRCSTTSRRKRARRSSSQPRPGQWRRVIARARMRAVNRSAHRDGSSAAPSCASASSLACGAPRRTRRCRNRRARLAWSRGRQLARERSPLRARAGVPIVRGARRSRTVRDDPRKESSPDGASHVPISTQARSMAESPGGQLRVPSRRCERATPGSGARARGPSARGVDAQTSADPSPTARLFGDRGSGAGGCLRDAHP